MADSNVFGTQFLYLTTTGRKTGLPREIEIWFVEREGLLYVLSEYPSRSQWYRNIIANPEVKVRIGERRWSATGRALDAQRDKDLYGQVQALSKQKYGWDEGAPVELRLE